MKKAILLLVVIVGIYGVLFSRQSEAAGETIDIEFDTDTYGQIQQSLGVILPSGFSDVAGVSATFSGLPIYLKLQNPTTGSVASTPFSTLQSAGFSWYFLFTTNTSARAVVDAYAAQYPIDRLVVELETVDVSFVSQLKTAYPGLKIHAGHLPVWPRSRVNEIYAQLQTPTIEGISFWMGTINTGSVWGDVRLTFDTFYDASKAIAGEEINHPANAILSVSNTQYPPYTDARKTAYMSGLISAALVSNVQSREGGEAPIKYIVPGTYTEFAPAEKTLLSHYARFMSLFPQIVWPMAIRQNGNPWDNEIFEESNTQPVVGTIGRILTGNFYGFLTNTSGQEVFVNVGNRIDFSTHRAVSILHGTVVAPNNGTFGIAANDTIVIYPNNLPNITPPPGVTITPGQNTPTTQPGTITPTPTTPVVSCDTQKKQGNFNCTGAVDEADFTAWKESFNAKSSSLSFFEYWRRTFHP